MKSSRLPKTEFLSILFLSVALSAAGFAHAQVVVEDFEFDNSDWAATILNSTGGPTQTAEQMLTGGSSGAYRYMTHDMSTTSSIIVFHEYLGSIYDPAVQGSIESVSYSESHIQFSPPFAGAEIGARPAIRQDQTVFRGPDITYMSDNWAHVELSSLGADDFISDGEAHPDFSASGAPIHFGYIRSNSTETGFDREHGIDNWRFEINCTVDDMDCDGIADAVDNCPLVANPDQTNTDLDLPGGDGDGDACDDDDDADTIPDTSDNCPLVPNPDQLDSDNDLIGDVCDNCVFVENPDQTNTDLDLPGGDGDGDVCDDDDDADTLADIQDNCRIAANLDQRDTDSDGLGNACDADIAPDPSGNCLVNFDDSSALAAAFFTNVSSPNWNPDADFDGNLQVNFNDLTLMVADFFKDYRTDNPSEAANACSSASDTDGDGVIDTNDNCTLLSNTDQRDTNGDGFGNVCDPDLDNECFVDLTDLGIITMAVGSTPGAPNWNPDADFDGDDDVDQLDAAVWNDFAFGPPGPSGIPNDCTVH